MIETPLFIGIIKTQLLAFAFLTVVYESAALRERMRSMKGPSPSISVGVATLFHGKS